MMPLHLPLEVILQLPLGAEHELAGHYYHYNKYNRLLDAAPYSGQDREPPDPEPCLCLILVCVSRSVRFFWKSAIRACL